ncbi:hypothetical protein ISM_00010 [Roseovarius nubinhibens ISM]|uniref:Uncharacterized protein n=1 Tax=Roseovarius nubinhibens (strain ATCC BAA-591 / DSM 15170 / ISM) TaxID=89187 RepID=A3SS48_ROSNI|nr:hypothetical protein ISM_00010 [Roseovarius nubinhibens ISM]
MMIWHLQIDYLFFFYYLFLHYFL